MTVLNQNKLIARVIPLIWTSATGIVEYHLIFNLNFFNLSVFELVGFQTKLFKDLWYMYFHAVKVFSMFFLSSLDFRWAYCGALARSSACACAVVGVCMRGRRLSACACAEVGRRRSDRNVLR